MLPRLNVKNIDETIRTTDGYCCVFFSSKACKPCDVIKGSAIKLMDKYEKKIAMFDFDGKQLGCKTVLSKYRVNFIPRMIVFRNGVEVGRRLWASYPVDRYDRCLEYALDEVLKNGRLTTESVDADEICFFRDRIMKLSSFRDDDSSILVKAKTLMTISDYIIEQEKEWAHLDKASLQKWVTNAMGLIKKGKLSIEDKQLLTQSST